MNFFSSVLLLVGVGFAILVPIFVGHALSNDHGQRFYLYGLIALVLAAGVIAAHVRSLRGAAPRDAHQGH